MTLPPPFGKISMLNWMPEEAGGCGNWDEMTSNYDPPRIDPEIWADVDSYLHSFS